MTFNRRLKLQEFQIALQCATKDPYKLAKTIQVIPSAASSNSTKNRNYSNSNEISGCYDEHGTDWSNIVAIWLDALEASENGDAVKCYEFQSTLHSQMNQIFASSVGNYLVPTLHSVCKSTHRTAIIADMAASHSNNSGRGVKTATAVVQDHTKLHNAVTLLQESFSRTYNDRKELRAVQFDTNHRDRPILDDRDSSSKKAGVLGIVNELFSIYFRLNTLRLCKNLVKPVEVRKLHIGTTGGVTIGQLVTYKYYTGRLFLFEDQYIDAENNLQYAYDNCHRNAYANKRRILCYLIPVKLYRGKLPSIELLEKYKLNEFISLVSSIKKGDLRTFNDALIDYQHRFIRQGTYLLLEKCKTVCYRNLFKRVHYVITSNPDIPANLHHQISLQQVRTIFHWLNMLIDLDEIECILANLIYRGYVRGYLSHSKRVLVLSKRDPFPLSSVVAK